MPHRTAQAIANRCELLEIFSGNSMSSRSHIRLIADATLTVTRRHQTKASLVAYYFNILCGILEDHKRSVALACNYVALRVTSLDMNGCILATQPNQVPGRARPEKCAGYLTAQESPAEKGHKWMPLHLKRPSALSMNKLLQNFSFERPNKEGQKELASSRIVYFILSKQ